jgi:hypothetical protein
MADMKADMAVLLAMMQRLDATTNASINGLAQEVRALHGQISRLRHRLEEMGKQ